MTQVHVDLRRFERTLIWQEFWFGREEQGNIEESIFKEQKTNMPKNHSVPEGLKMFLNAIKSDLCDPRNRNKEECNLPQYELKQERKAHCN